MITSFEVGSVFKIVDQATPVLRSLARDGSKVDKIVTSVRLNLEKVAAVKLAPVIAEIRSFTQATAVARPELSAFARSIGLVDKRLGTLTGTAQASGTALTTVFGAMTTGASTALAEVSALTAEWRALALSIGAASRTLRLAAPADIPVPGGRGHGGRGGGNYHVSSFSAPLPGGLHARARFGGNATMAGLGALAYGVYEEAEIEDIAARAIMTGQLKVDRGMTSMDAFKKIRSVIQKNASAGGFDPKEVGEAILGSERQFAGLSFDKRMDVLNVLLPAAMQEARFKETPLKESAESLVGLAHMTGTYDPAKLPDLYRKFNFASMITPASLPEFSRALSYSMPSLVAGMGMDPETIMFITAMNQAAGIKSTKAGTWVQSFFGKLMPDVGVNLTKSQVKHNEALFNMGLIDSPTANAKPTWMVNGPGGRTDWMASLLKLTPILGDKLQALPDTQRLQVLDQVFGKQGGREAGLMNLKEFVDQFPRLAQLMQTAPGGDDFLKQLGEGSPVQKAREAFSDLKDVLMDIGSVALPPLTEALRGVDAMLKGISDHFPSQGSIGGLPEHGSLGEALGKGMAVGGLIGGVGGSIIPGVGTLTGAAGGAFVGGVYEGGKYLWDKLTQSFSQITIAPAKVALNLDKRQIAEAVIQYTARQGAGPAEGAPYHDSTYSTSPVDFALP